MQKDVELYITYNHTMDKLEDIKTTHPNIYELWKNVLDKKIQSIQKTLREAEIMIENSKQIPDLTKEQIVCMLLFAK